MTSANEGLRTIQRLTEIHNHDRMAYDEDINTIDWVGYTAAMQKMLYLEAAHDRHFLLKLVANLQTTVAGLVIELNAAGVDVRQL